MSTSAGPTGEARRGRQVIGDGGHHGSRHNPTPGEVPAVGPRQAIALERLLSGSTVTQAAAAANVDRSTLHRWARVDPAFRAAFNLLRRDLLREVHARLLGLTSLALQAIATALASGDARVAISLLRGLGMLDGTPPTIGPVDPAEVAEMDEHVARFEAHQRAERRRRFR